jgi:hypothetical protein
MAADSDLNRLLWAVGEARRLRHGESVQSADHERRNGESEASSLDQPGRPPLTYDACLNGLQEVG